MANRLDIIVFGASGFTGQHTVGVVHKLSKANNRTLTWAIAGRSESKLQAILDELIKDTNDEELSKIPIIIADLSDEKSILNMASQGKVVINCCGPYRFMGETVVKACIQAKTHHVDVSGEPQYMERMQLEYNEKAREAGVYIVSACGFDSIPADLSLIFLQKKFNGTLNSVETFLESGTKDTKNLPGPSVNYGTWESAVYGVAHMNELRPLRQKLFPKRLPRFQPPLAPKKLPFQPEIVDGWALPFLGSDKSVMQRSQRYFYEEFKRRPVQVQTYFMLKRFWHILVFGLLGSMFLMLCKFEFGRNLLKSYPEIFSLGFFSKKEPLKEKVEKAWFSITLHGKGWSEPLANPGDQYTTPPNKSIIGKVSGMNPGYGATCICLVLSAIMTITESNKLPKKGGVYSPGAAFAETTLIDQLNENGVKFEIISEKDI